MPNPAPRRPAKPQKPAAKGTVFPSLRLWEEPWEAGLDLSRLRANREKISGLAELLDQRDDHVDKLVGYVGNHKEHAGVGQNSLETIVDRLGLDRGVARRLVDDALLIATWHVAPTLLAELRMGLSQHVAALEQSAKLARKLHLAIATNLSGITALIDALPAKFSVEADQLDVDELTNDLDLFVRSADRVIDRMGFRGPGRKADQRRNLSIALATEAVEEATGTAVTITRPTDGEWRFTNREGAFVRDVLGLLDWTNERILVGAFDKLRRTPRVKVLS